jgi:predicted lipid-binding transport protein (Tim44 family)
MKSPYTVTHGWMQRTSTALFALFIGLALVAQDADARRLGGGGSFGRQSPNVTRQAAPPTNSAAPAKPAPAPQAAPQSAQPSAAAQPSRNRWLGPLAGLAAGVGLAALFSHFGMGAALAEGLGSLLLIALLVFAAVFIWRMLRGGAPAQRRMEPAYAGSDGAEPVQPKSLQSSMLSSGVPLPGSVAATAGTSVSGVPLTQSDPAISASWEVPADFDSTGFLRNAKVYFVRLQTAWDQRNLVDIREFTTPEAFAEIRVQVDEQKSANDKTEVVALDAQLLGVETGDHDYLASVRFSGAIRENDMPAAEPFVEVWNLTKPKSGRTGWLLAGIQQIH